MSLSFQLFDEPKEILCISPLMEEKTTDDHNASSEADLKLEKVLESIA